MEKRIIREADIEQYKMFMRENEKSELTIEKYMRDLRKFKSWIGKQPVTKEITTQWKQYLLGEEYAPVTINSMLAAINGFFSFKKWSECKIKILKIQRRMFREKSRELTKAEYGRLLTAAKALGKSRLALLIETIGATGIRVSEVKFITVDAVRKGRTDVLLKGKVCTILIPTKLCKKLLNYAKARGIDNGEIFVTRTGKSLSRRQIWVEMKNLCITAKVEPTKVFPHNLRHLFAKTFYRIYKDIAGLADVLGHSSIDTTRIYLVTSGIEYRKKLSRIGLLS